MYEKPEDYDKIIYPKLDRALGYLVFCDKNHPLARSRGVVYHHRHIASLKIGRWLTKKEVVHHKNEKKSDNRPENLEIHTKSSHAKIHNKYVWDNSKRKCELCKKIYVPLDRKQVYCSRKCCYESTIRFEVSKQKLEKMIWEMPTTKIAKIFGVSDKAIEKRCKKLGVTKPPRGYWAKQMKKS